MKWLPVVGEPPADVIVVIADILRSSGVVILPTDTIYGLHAVSSDVRAVQRIVWIKGREEKKPFVIIAASVEQLEQLDIAVPAILRTLWPGPLTAVLERDDTTVAVRIPDLSWLRNLIGRTGPLVSTSANRSGEASVSTPRDLAADLQNSVDAIVDAGPRSGEASAIVDFTQGQPRLIREGNPDFTQNLRKTLRISL